MTLATLLYALAAGALTSVGAWALATVFRMAGHAERWVWGAGMAVCAFLSVAPFVAALSGDPRAGAIGGEFRISERASGAASPTAPARSPRAALLSGVDLDMRIPFALELWLAMSAGLLLAATASELRHRRRSSGFRRVRMHGIEAWQSPDQGPAVWGALAPRLVVPARIAELDVDDQRLVLAHEAEHLRARDPALNALAAALLALVPWNPLLWTLRRGLARAIESDCDRRTLEGTGAGPRAYAELVLRVAAWQPERGRGPLVLTMGRSARELHGRLGRVLNPTPPRRAGALAGVALIAVGAAAPLLGDPPDARPGGPALTPVSSPAAEPAGAIYRAREIPARPTAVVREREEP